MENSDRTWFEFGLDSSKQIMGAGWIHVANLLCAVLFAGRLPGVDGCTWYAANIIVDTTAGVAVEWCLLRGLHHLLIGLRCVATAKLLDSGSYRDSSGAFRPLAYVTQMVVWLSIVTCMKVGMVGLMKTVPVIVLLVNSALSSLEDTPKIKLVVVMIFVPLMMNTFQFVLTDGFIKKRKRADPLADGLIAKE
eukprot:CAMPEP_0115584504 /NCGR_PEP_ID=MMETSP0272-20121206/6718_1 /TAXON_ID=71861 /ORGANISM="Scrippsiella trochoidea, Strain CCMP3099" /LENGTH=191 /DNA_ID=CAMNT_0003019541 /DNA_START=111 /DNA_END=684 /DNA_ORIENTATION=-